MLRRFLCDHQLCNNPTRRTNLSTFPGKSDQKITLDVGYTCHADDIFLAGSYSSYDVDDDDSAGARVGGHIGSTYLSVLFVLTVTAGNAAMTSVVGCLLDL